MAEVTREDLGSALISIRIDGRLRFPQLEAVETFADSLLRARIRLESPTDELSLAFQQFAGHRRAETPWHEFDMALATGVGKTRLAGALIELLMLSGVSRSILVLSHRRLLQRRWKEVLNPQSSESVVPLLRGHPGLVTLESFVDWSGLSRNAALIVSQTIQALSSELTRPSQPISEMDLLDELANRDDLVVIFDESHHLRPATHSRDASSWVQTLTQLAPKLLIGLTATPRRERHVLYEYGLKRLLSDGLFSKSLIFVVSDAKSGAGIRSEEELTASRALALLDQKRHAVQQLPQGSPLRGWSPALLILVPRVADIATMEEILTARLDVDASRILSVSGSTVGEDELEVLRAFDADENLDKDIVIAAFMLDEGWDVKRVSVIAPMRNLASIQNATQVVGRGLRLPAGRRVGHKLLDALHVFVSDQQSLLEIRDQVQDLFGTNGADVEDASSETSSHGVVVAREDSVETQFSARGATRMRLVRSSLPPCPIPVLVPNRFVAGTPTRWSINGLDERLAAVDAVTAGLSQIELERSPLKLDEAVRVVASESSFLTRHDVRAALINWCQSHGTDVPSTIGVVQLGQIARDYLGASHFEYIALSETHEFPEDVEYLCSASSRNVRPHGETWEVRQWYSGWNKSLYDISRFDSYPEFMAAKLLEGMTSVDVWFRNDPRLFRIHLPTGLYSPDFIVWSGERVVFLEVKGKNLLNDFNLTGRLQSLNCYLDALRVCDLSGSFAVVSDDELQSGILAAVGAKA